VLIIRVRHAIDTNLLPAVENPDRGGPHRRHALPLSPISCQRRGQSAMEYEELCFGVRGARPWTGHRGGQERGSSPPQPEGGCARNGHRRSPTIGNSSVTRLLTAAPRGFPYTSRRRRLGWYPSQSRQVFLCCKCMFRVFSRFRSNVASCFILMLQK
jgi:hypothetical protein